MRNRITLFFVAVVIAIAPWMWTELRSQQPLVVSTSPGLEAAGAVATSASAGGVISTVQTLSAGKTQVIILDVNNRSMAVYHIAPDMGVIELKSVRNIDADLKLKDFNGTKPTPDEVRAVVQP